MKKTRHYAKCRVFLLEFTYHLWYNLAIKLISIIADFRGEIMTFGSLLRRLREEKRLRQADIANAIGVSTVYICDIEKDRRNPPSYKKLQLIAGKLDLTEEKTAELFDLAGRARGEVAPDIIAYLVANPAVQASIRQTMRRERNI